MRMLKVVCAAAVVASLVAMAPQAQARPQYLKAFVGEYDHLEAKAKEKKCGVCHGEGGKNKKVVSAYGKAMGAGLGKKNQKDAEAIVKALKAAAEMKCGDGDKIWGDVLKDGLPPAAP